MTINIGLIRWPDDKTLSVRLYLSFLIEVTELLNINFYEDNNPIKITKKYLGRLITNEDRKLALSYWWQCIDDKNIRNFKDRSSLMSRLAICFLSINEENIDEVSEYLSWFIEVLGFLSFNLSEVITFMGEYFEFKSNVDENV
ncbi:hypothetical protein [Pectobacterium parmentieri]|uniref:Uncharacterized protein n=1 Tax=Pectobacterium parmentieri TaxID=1905730 RepID=A0A8B3FK87_PECPM|nr:hypothetical protein [Pectobacterium parmentieri]AOR61144.1 hypothetical protein A8F97_19945 [Pectobacterium parmentieri]AYH12191.1 hypothetical protein C5E24_22170 [Pectobacterium parmentieri]AYH20905.1 hypothetical protein C5E22_22050 [Pectobacterium parmentieri]AYH38468.1 hypothetical protein C5E17_21895 [Pectobacterium parmentieri]AZS58695.1 hypothetical protein C5E18_22580 [Pectobacterium parmentieri]